MLSLARNAVPALKRTTATALRCSSSAMSTLRPTSSAPRHLATAAPASLQTRAFSGSAALRSATTVQNDPKWKNGEKVTYEEVKPLTQSPSDVRAAISIHGEFLRNRANASFFFFCRVQKILRIG